MTRLIWSNASRPGGEPADFLPADAPERWRVERTRRIERATRDFELPSRKALRTMSRAGVLLSAAALPAAAQLESEDPFRIGLYCAVDNGPHDYTLCAELPAPNAQGYAKAFRRHQPPTAYLRQLPNLAAAQLGIFLGVMGPTHAFTDSRAGAHHALDQADLELAMGIVDVALVCGAFALDDPFAAMRAREDAPAGSVLCEGAAALLLAAGEGRLVDTAIDGDWYANCHPLMELTNAA